ncbi:hypothetical protein LTR85_003269 [Meristemomyces frigidus]|nr:hypothetical protein LTR85_003269 [Meristemomyces frigidus]
MTHRKIWVCRPGASATLVQIRDDDLVDDVRDMILNKYANSLGRAFDAPDLTLRIVQRAEQPRQQQYERTLGPEEVICRVLDLCFPGGQTVEDALIVDVPHERRPQPSPTTHRQASYQAVDHYRPAEWTDDFRSSMPQNARSYHWMPGQSFHHPSVAPRAQDVHQARTLGLNTGKLSPLSSPGGARRPREHQLAHQPATRPRAGSSASRARHPVNVPALSPSSPAARVIEPPRPSGGSLSTPSQARRPANGQRPRQPESSRKRSTEQRGSVPPINVLIAEDNPISLRVVQQQLTRWDVQWQTATNGHIAVEKWKAGGVHLVLMDILMPVMDGLNATREIRRLERANGIGIFDSATTTPEERTSSVGNTAKSSHYSADSTLDGQKKVDDKLIVAEGHFRSPVIIVALTASSLQSDRQEALAAGCNDFLTKPVDSGFLRQKVTEWGCMQALVDFDGWRRWKDRAAEG